MNYIFDYVKNYGYLSRIIEETNSPYISSNGIDISINELAKSLLEEIENGKFMRSLNNLETINPENKFFPLSYFNFAFRLGSFYAKASLETNPKEIMNRIMSIKSRLNDFKKYQDLLMIF